MRTALMQDGGLGAPSVGTWQPDVHPGGAISGGVRLGRLWRAGRPLEVMAPEGAEGVVVDAVAAGSWVEHGTRLCALGSGIAVGSAAVRPAARRGEESLPDGVVAVRAETDGTVWLRPEPGAPAFVAPGGQVARHDTVALVEVMKTFGAVRAPLPAVVEKVLVADGAAVLAGAPLLWLRPLS